MAHHRSQDTCFLFLYNYLILELPLPNTIMEPDIIQMCGKSEDEKISYGIAQISGRTNEDCFQFSLGSQHNINGTDAARGYSFGVYDGITSWFCYR